MARRVEDGWSDARRHKENCGVARTQPPPLAENYNKKTLAVKGRGVCWGGGGFNRAQSTTELRRVDGKLPAKGWGTNWNETEEKGRKNLTSARLALP